MHAASPVWCGITEFFLAPFSLPCSNFGFGCFSEMILLISVSAGRIQDPALPRWLSRYWPEWDCICALRCLVYGAKRRGDLTLRFFFSSSSSSSSSFWQPTEGRTVKSRNPCFHWGWRKKTGHSRDFRDALAFTGIRTVRGLRFFSLSLCCWSALYALTFWGSVRGAEISVSTLSCIAEVDPDLRCC